MGLRGVNLSANIDKKGYRINGYKDSFGTARAGERKASQYATAPGKTMASGGHCKH
jgi:hypothetical protein